jgi:hypothetical protein
MSTERDETAGCTDPRCEHGVPGACPTDRDALGAELILASDWLARDRAASEARGAAAERERIAHWLRDVATAPVLNREWLAAQIGADQ